MSVGAVAAPEGGPMDSPILGDQAGRGGASVQDPDPDLVDVFTQLNRSVRRRQDEADRDAAALVADQAEQDAAATRFHAEAAAIRVHQAALSAAVAALRGEADPIGPAAQRRASEVAATVETAAAAIAEQTAELAVAVARVVAARAEEVTAMQGGLAQVIDAELVATAAALGSTDLETAGATPGGRPG